MKTHLKCEKKAKGKESEKKKSSLIMDDIINDYNNIIKDDDMKNIFKWRTIEDSVICRGYNDFKPGKKLLSFDLDDTITTFGNKKSGKSKSPDKGKEEAIIFSFDINKIESKLDEYQKK